MAFLYVKNKEDALDVVQEVAYQSFSKIKTLKKPEYFKTWLIKIVINCSLQLLNKKKKVIQLTPEFDEFMGSSDEDLPLTLSLKDVINTLMEEEKTVLLLRFYHGYTFKEISEMLDIPLGTAKTVLYRSLEKLRKEFKEVK
ncbi:RNA polymerase sigma-70 factor (ECF subfamily) [Bacillus mesophilus]|nr:RNA polymerase sigma-70 factor (ECF subfamily) [Bacillus mesophilus]